MEHFAPVPHHHRPTRTLDYVLAASVIAVGLLSVMMSVISHI